VGIKRKKILWNTALLDSTPASDAVSLPTFHVDFGTPRLATSGMPEKRRKYPILFLIYQLFEMNISSQNAACR